MRNRAKKKKYPISLLNPPMMDLIDFLNNLLNLDGLMTMIASYTRSTIDLQTSREEAEAR